MKKKLYISLFFSLFFGFFFLTSSTLASERFPFFSDLSPNHKNFSAITVLQTNGIINGYKDGTFKPDQKVSRAEALKILLLGSNIQESTSLSENPFPDVHKNQWFAGFVQKAKEKNIINGRANGNFVPTDTINKAEAVKMLMLVNDVTLSEKQNQKIYADVYPEDWFAQYFQEAKKRNVFPESTEQKISPAHFLTRGELVEMMYRFDLYEKGHTKEKLEAILWGDTNLSPNLPSLPRTIGKNEWEDVELEKNLLPVFRENEIFVLKGNTNAKEVAASVTDSSGERRDIKGSVVNGSFSIPIFFPTTGKVDIGIFTENKSTSKIYSGEVVGGKQRLLSTQKNQNIPQNVSAVFENGKLQLSWQKNGNNFFHVYLLQNGVVKDFWTKENKVFIPESLLKDFHRGKIFIAIQGNSTKDSSLEMQSKWSDYSFGTYAIYHAFTTSIDTQEMVLESFTWEYDSEIRLSGKMKNGIQNVKAFVMDGNENLYEKPITQNGENISFSFTPKTKDFFLIEITDSGGMEIAVLPASPKGFAPVIPIPQTNKVKLSNKKSDVYDRIAQLRSDKNRNQLQQSQSLETLAQIRADDMANRNYFSHTTPNGKTVNDIRSDFDIRVSVAENISYSSLGALDAAKNLEFSITHRNTLLGKNFTQVGVGIAQTENDESILVQLFAEDEAKIEDVDLYAQEILESFLEKFPHLQEENLLHEASRSWAKTMAIKKEINTKYASGESWKDMLNEFKILRDTNIFIASLSSKQNFHTLLENKNELEKMKNIGIGVWIADNGYIFITILGTK